MQIQQYQSLPSSQWTKSLCHVILRSPVAPCKKVCTRLVKNVGRNQYQQWLPTPQIGKQSLSMSHFPIHRSGAKQSMHQGCEANRKQRICLHISNELSALQLATTHRSLQIATGGSNFEIRHRMHHRSAGGSGNSTQIDDDAFKIPDQMDNGSATGIGHGEIRDVIDSGNSTTTTAADQGQTSLRTRVRQ